MFALKALFRSASDMCCARALKFFSMSSPILAESERYIKPPISELVSCSGAQQVTNLGGPCRK